MIFWAHVDVILSFQPLLFDCFGAQPHHLLTVFHTTADATGKCQSALEVPSQGCSQDSTLFRIGKEELFFLEMILQVASKAVIEHMFHEDGLWTNPPTE